MIQTLSGLKSLKLIKEPHRKKESHSLHPFFPSYQKCVKIKEESSSERSCIYETFEDINLILQYLEFKVWEHPNLKVSTLTLKKQFFFII